MEVLKHEGPGRLGLVRLGEHSFRTPALAGVEFTLSPFNSFFHPDEVSDHDFNLAPSIPLGFYTPAEIIEKVIGRLWSVSYSGFNTFYLPALRRIEYLDEFFKIIERYNFEAVYLGNSKILVKEYRYFVKILRELRERFPNIMIIADLEPFFYPLAVYLGIDAFDTRSLKLYDFEGKGFTRFSPFLWDKEPNSFDFARETILLVRKALEEGKLRYLVENFFNTQYHSGILRIADLEYPDYLEKYTPMQKETVYFISDASIRRPEVRRWHSRIIERFTPPKNTELVLLFPCSARKPYSFSRSHTLYRKVVKEALGPGISKVHELILTSPFGVVPRELEWLAKYDIVVTGHWSEEEIKPAARLLAKTLEKYPKGVPIVAHLDEAYVEIARLASEISGREVIFTHIENGTTSMESLNSLTETLKEFELEGTKEDRTYRYFENIRKVFDFYFGVGAGEAVLPENGHAKGSKMLRIFAENQQTGTFREGVISVTPFGMQRIYDSLKAYWVRIDFDLRGDVFAVGVNEADERIRPDDIVGVVRDEKVVGVGRAVLAGEEMVKAKKGVAVKVRKRA
ncbi:archaeosine synthase subunit alpha [Thermococcus sp.]|uniref:archaeosine synthase subunit alpha n=1 Tax=Thermococcus sp. TaxID=35749 RepID=UPI00261551B0|nr:archaeosine synthase subunit alpha [Thermococcus sp.]